jgi:hypothetical protein
MKQMVYGNSAGPFVFTSTLSWSRDDVPRGLNLVNVAMTGNILLLNNSSKLVAPRGEDNATSSHSHSG